MPVIRHQLTTTLMIFFSELAHCSSIFPIPPIQCNFFECSHSWILKICATYYLGYQTDLVKKKNLYKCRGTFIVIRSTWMSELLYYIPTYYYYYYILLTRCLIGSTDQTDARCFYIRISWVLMERCCFYFFRPLHFMLGLRSLKHWLLKNWVWKLWNKNLKSL